MVETARRRAGASWLYTRGGGPQSANILFPGLLKKYSANILLTTVFIALGCK